MAKKILASITTYLDRVQFDPKLWNSPIARYITNIRLVILLVLTITLLGAGSYFNLPRRLNPEVEIPIVTVVTLLPGASPEDIESLVTVPLENQLKGLANLDTLNSSSTNNVSVITAQFLSRVSAKDAETAVQSTVDTFTDLPDDAKSPTVTAIDFENQPVLTFAVTNKNDDVPALMQVSQVLEKKLEESSVIDTVDILGFESQEIVVEIDPTRIAQYQIQPLQLSALIIAAIPSYPAGNVRTDHHRFSLTIDPAITSIEAIRAIPLSLQGQRVVLGDIATVQERSVPQQRVAYVATESQTALRAVTFNVYKTKSANISSAARTAETIVDEVLAGYGEKFDIYTVTNTGEEVDEQFNDLLGEFRATILLVSGCLLLFLGIRQAAIASLTVPLTFLSAFIFMNLTGMSINFLSLFAFLLALGLLVDDSIVVVSAMTTYFKTKRFTPQETGLLVWRDTIVPIWSTTLTTIWSFVPLLLSTGIIGEFIKPIPVVVTATMISSTAIAVLVTLPMMIVLLQPKIAKRVIVLAKVLGFVLSLGILAVLLRGNMLFVPIVLAYCLCVYVVFRIRTFLLLQVRQQMQRAPRVQRALQMLRQVSDRGVINFVPVEHAYHRLILRVLRSGSARRNVMIGSVLYAVIAFFLVPLGFVKNEFFPKTDAEQLSVVMELPSGSTLERTEAETLRILDELRTTTETTFVTAEVGKAASGDGFGGSSETSNAATYTLHFTPIKSRSVTSSDIAIQVRTALAKESGVKISIIEASGGPPAGADVQVTLLGDDLGVLDQYADQVVQYLETQSGINALQKSIKPGTSAVVFVPDDTKVLTAGLTRQQLGLWLRMYASGLPIDDVRLQQVEQGDETPVVFRIGSGVQSVESLRALVIPTATGPVALGNLGDVTTKANPVSINRTDGKRTLSVTAGVQSGVSISDANKKLIEFVKTIEFADGYGWQTGGVNEENAKSVQSILQAMVVAFVLILVTMVIQFGSYRQAIIVLIVIPLAVSSVFYVFALTGTPLSFPALIGVLSLFGIVVTNSMFIVDKINLNLREGMEFMEAIADAGSSRLEPIVLTKLCTVLGLLPITLADPLWRGLGGAIISGLLFASTIMLLFIPVLYYTWFGGSQKEKGKRERTENGGRRNEEQERKELGDMR